MSIDTQITLLYKANSNQQAIADTLGSSRSFVRRALVRLGLKTEKKRGPRGYKKPEPNKECSCDWCYGINTLEQKCSGIYN